MQASPQEVIINILRFLPLEYVTNLALTCKHVFHATRDNHAVSAMIFKKYGNSRLALCNAILDVIYSSPNGGTVGTTWPPILLNNRPYTPFVTTTTRIQLTTATKEKSGIENKESLKSLALALTPEVASLMIRQGASFPRYICQISVKQVGRLPTSLFAFVVSTGYRMYGEMANFYANDNSAAIKLIMEGVIPYWIGDDKNKPTQLIASDTTQLKILITNFSYVPMSIPTLDCQNPPGNLAYLLFKLANMDITLVDTIRENGFDFNDVNDDVLKWALRRQSVNPLEMLKLFIQHGFILTPSVIIYGIKLPKLEVLVAFQMLIPKEDLEIYAKEAISDLLGPDQIYTAEGVLDHIRNFFDFQDDAIGEALLGVPQNAEYKTRPYLQQHPATAWRWTLKKFGPNHKFTKAAFDDILKKLSLGPESHCCLRNLPDQFVAAGVKLTHSHVQHLAVIAAASDEHMVNLAERLFFMLNAQLMKESHRFDVFGWLPILQSHQIQISRVNVLKSAEEAEHSSRNRRSKRRKIKS